MVNLDCVILTVVSELRFGSEIARLVLFWISVRLGKVQRRRRSVVDWWFSVGVGLDVESVKALGSCSKICQESVQRRKNRLILG